MSTILKSFAWTRPDGGVSITHVDERDRWSGETDEELCHRMLTKHGASNAVPVTAHEIPPRDGFRSCWSLTPKKGLHVCLTKARELTKQRLRQERVPLFAANDLVLRDASLAGDKAALQQGLAERDRLRDLPQRAEVLTSLEALKTITAKES